MKMTWIILMTLMTCTLAFSQWADYNIEDNNELDAGIGMTWIDGTSYITLSFRPDISIGKFGIGLGVQLLYDPGEGKLRTEDWNSSYDYARLIRYLRYGHKGDTFYSRVGALDAARLGHGFVLNYYNNQINYDDRKIGLIVDVDAGRFGFETLTNNMGRLEVLGGRIYYRPMYESSIPILRNFAAGAGYITDLDPDAWRGSKDGVAIWGFDVELPLIKSDIFELIPYADHAHINGYGSGQALGIRTELNALWGLLDFSLSVERRYMGERFIAPYFDPFYEQMRYTTRDEQIEYFEDFGGNLGSLPEEIAALPGNTLIGKKMFLPMMDQKIKGWFGGLYLDFLYIIRTIGTFQRIDDQTNSGILHLEAGLANEIPIFDLQAAYDKRGIEKAEDIFTLDRRSIARVGVGYKIKPYLLLYLDYIWTFEWDEVEAQYVPQERFQPRLAFRYRF